MKAKKLIITICVVAMVAIMAVGMMACTNKPSQIKVIEIKLTDEEYAFGVKKGDAKLLADVNGVIAKMKDNGEMDKIMNKYFNGDAVTAIASAKKDSSKNQLIVATNTGFAPFEYTDGGTKFLGIDMEIAQYIAKELQKELVIDDMDFDAVVTSVGQGKADIAMAGLTVSEKRKESVDFTTTYYKASQMVVVKAADTTFNNCKTVADVEKVLAELKGKKIGFQNGTTSEYYVKGDADMEFAGFKNIAPKGYDNAGLAVTDMVNGNIDFVIVDEMPAKTLAKKF